jgi:hypothetical protein
MTRLSILIFAPATALLVADRSALAQRAVLISLVSGVPHRRRAVLLLQLI